MSLLRTVFVSFVVTSACLACEGKVLDVGTSNRSAQAAGDQESPDAATPVTIGVPGIWAMTRQDGVFGVEFTESPPPPMQVEITEDGNVFVYQCVTTSTEPATAPCGPSAAVDCRPGLIRSEGTHWRMNIPAIAVGGLPEQGETLLLDDGTLMVRYIHPTFSAGYFKRVSPAGTVGPCPR